MNLPVKTFFTLAALFFIFSLNSYSEVKLPKLIGDGMVLQRETKIKIWGWASISEKVTVTFQNKKLVSTTDKNGRWSVTLPPTKAGGPYEILIEGSNKIHLKDILFGDVWVCSGQSNMALPMDRVKGKYADITTSSSNPNIRLFFVPTVYEFTGPKEDLPGTNWLSANPQNVLSFSAVAYFFARDLYEKYKVPIGLISSSVGGSPVEAWMSEEALKPFPQYLAVTEQHKRKEFIDSIIKTCRFILKKC